MNRYIFTLMLSTFALGLSEFMPMGLLPIIAGDLSISIPKAGFIVTAYAVGVTISSPIITLLLSPLDRKRALIMLMLIFIFGNILSVLSVGYNTLLVSRIITSFAHGSFFGIGAIVAINLTPVEKKAGAVSMVFMGLTIANIGGVPLAAWFGEIVGWRLTFIATTILGVIAAMSIFFIIPKDESVAKVDIKNEVKALIRPSVLIIFVGTVIFSTSLFTLYTYIAVILKDITEATPTFIAIILSIVGIGFTVGGMLSNRIAIIWSIDKAIILFFLSTGVIMMLYSILATTYIGAAIATFIWGVTGYATSPLLQTKIVQTVKDAPTLVSSVNIGIFNLGNAIGAFVGGAVINLGLGYSFIAPVGGVISIIGVFTILIPLLLLKRNLVN